jgi:hypothetical protein
MDLNIDDLDALQSVHDSLSGACTLLLGLASYDGIGSDARPAINTIAKVLEADRAELQRILSGDVVHPGPQ